MMVLLSYTGMNMLNISVDTLRPERFEEMTRRRGHERVMGAIHNAIQLGYDPVKVGRRLLSSTWGYMQAPVCSGACGTLCRRGHSWAGSLPQVQEVVIVAHFPARMACSASSTYLREHVHQQEP